MDKAQNRVTGVFKLLFAVGMACSAAAWGLSGSWLAVPAAVAALSWGAVGAVQAVTGAGEDY
jgi:hypothetical protein